MQHIDVGGRRLAFQLLGGGEPTVVFETGMEDSSVSLLAVAQEVSGFTSALVYDRAGLGASDPAPRPRTSADVARDLRSLLDGAGVARPCVFVGHSFGGMHLRCYAGAYPADVAGVVLIDASHPDQTPRALQLHPPAAPGEPAALAASRDDLQREWADPLANAEGIDVAASAAQVRAAQTLGSVPLIVITAGLDSWAEGFPPDVARALEADWRAMQRELAQLSSDSEHLTAAASEHAIQNTEPELIVAAVRRLVTRHRRRPA